MFPKVVLVLFLILSAACMYVQYLILTSKQAKHNTEGTVEIDSVSDELEEKNEAISSVDAISTSEVPIKNEAVQFLPITYGPIENEAVQFLPITYVPENINYVINPKYTCGYTNVTAVMLVVSRLGNMVTRSAWRRAYSDGELRSLRVRRVFLLGMAAPGEQELERGVFKESKRHGDILMGDFTDVYSNLTLKLVMGLRWGVHFCGQKPFRGVRDAYYIPYEQYSKEYYPQFVVGPMYAMTPTTAVHLLRYTSEVPFFPLEDVYVTGFLAEAANVPILGLCWQTIAFQPNIELCLVKEKYKTFDCVYFVAQHAGRFDQMLHFKEHAEFCFQNICHKVNTKNCTKNILDVPQATTLREKLGRRA